MKYVEKLVHAAVGPDSQRQTRETLSLGMCGTYLQLQYARGFIRCRFVIAQLIAEVSWFTPRIYS